MLRSTVANLISVIEEAALHLQKAAGSDGVLGKREYRRKLAQLSENQQVLVDNFYRFLCEKEPKFQQKLTNFDIEEGLKMVRERFISRFEREVGELSKAELDCFSEEGPCALALAVQLKQRAQEGSSELTGAEVFDLIRPHTPTLFFDYLASENSHPIEAVFFPTQLRQLTQEGLYQAMGLDPTDPSQVIERLVPAEPYLLHFIDQHRLVEQEKHAAALVSIMKTHLRELSILVIGRDDVAEVGAEHDAYLLGLAADGSLVGFQTLVWWS